MKNIFSVLFSLIAVTGFAQDEIVQNPVAQNEIAKNVSTNGIAFENPAAASLPISATTRVLQFENEAVRVWKTTVLPNQPLKMHRHDNDRIVVTLKGGNLAKMAGDGTLTPRIFETGKAYWLGKDASNALHASVNKSNEPIEVIVIEMKNR